MKTTDTSEGRPIHISHTYRWVENGHILLWLIKDTCWALELKAGGILMIFPTVAVAFFILWKSRNVRSELFHNIAVSCWILANSVWMLGEFFDSDTRIYAAMFFGIGLLILIAYYSFCFRADRSKEKAYELK